MPLTLYDWRKRFVFSDTVLRSVYILLRSAYGRCWVGQLWPLDSREGALRAGCL